MATSARVFRKLSTMTLSEGAELAGRQSDLWRSVVERAEDGQRALIVTHEASWSSGP